MRRSRSTRRSPSARLRLSHELVLHQIELLSPGRGSAFHRDHAVALAHGPRLRRDPLAERPAPAALDGGEEGRGLGVRADRPDRVAECASARRGRSRRQLARRPPGQRAPVADRDLMPLAERRQVVGLGRREQRLPAAVREMLDEQPAVGRVELAADVVEEHQRRRPPVVEQRPPLGEQERQERGALLALGAVTAQGAAAGLEGELVVVRAPPGVAARDVRLAALGQLGGELGRAVAPRCAVGIEAAVAASPSASAARRTARRARSTACGPDGDQLDPGRRRARGPRRRASAVAVEPARIRPSSALRCASAARVTAPGLGAGRPQRGAEAVQVSAASAGGPFTRASRSGMKTASAGRWATASASAGAAIDQMPAPLGAADRAQEGRRRPVGPTVASARASDPPNAIVSRSSRVRHERPASAL